MRMLKGLTVIFGCLILLLPLIHLFTDLLDLLLPFLGFLEIPHCLVMSFLLRLIVCTAA